MLQGIGGLLPCPTTPSALHTSLVKTTKMLMPCLGLNGLRQWTYPLSQYMLFCDGVQAPHSKIETLCHGAQVVGVLTQCNMPPSMTPLEWSQAQAQDPAICQIVEAICHKTLGTLRIKKDMPLDLKAFLWIRKQFKLKQGIL